MSLSAEEKSKLIKALEEDQEFRYAIAGMLGYREILDRITSLEERFAKLEERFANLEERFARLEEKFAKLEERQTRLEEEMRDTRRVLTIIAHRFGVISESSFREGMKYVVEEVLGVAKVSRQILRDDEGLVYGHPSDVEVDVVIKDEEGRVVRKLGVQDGCVSGVHAMLVFSGGKPVLEVLTERETNTRIGHRIGDKVVEAVVQKGTYPLKDGSVITLGFTRFEVICSD